MKISIITPSYNQGEFIERTVQSVANQAPQLPKDVSIQHVVYDGASNDNTLDILRAYESQITWVSEPDNGQAHAVNKGIESTDGEIIGWLNSDDIYYPGSLAKVVQYFNDNPEVDVVYGQGEHIDTEDKVINSYPTEDFDFKKLVDHCFICQPALFFRRRILKKTGLLDESLDYCMDYEFWVRISSLGLRFAYLPEVLAGSRLYADNKTLSSKTAVHKEINDMLKKHLRFVPKRSIINYAYAVIGDELDKSATPYRFAYKLLHESLRAAKHWNGGIFRFVSEASRHWLRALMLGRFKMWRKTL